MLLHTIVEILTGQRQTPQRAHQTITNSAAMTDPTQGTTETLTHKNRLLWQQSNLQACLLTINGYSVLLA